MNAFEEAFGRADPYIPEETRLSNENTRFTTAFCHMDRALFVHEDLLGFSAAELPPDSTLLVVGSGATRKFERQLYDARPDVLAVSLDPLLRYGIQERHLESVRWGGRRKGSEYYIKKDEFPGQITNGDAYFRRAAMCGGFVLQQDTGEMPEIHYNYLPFRSNVFDTVLGLHSVPQYTAPEHIPPLMAEVVRVTKPGGRVMLYPILKPDIPIISRIIRNNTGMADPLFSDPERTYVNGPTQSEAKRFSFTKAS